MIYVCIPSFNAAPTVGLVLWKVRQVFAAFPREYHLLVADDASSDATSDVLASYQRALPVSVIRHEQRRGHAACVEALLREALTRSDRPKRDAAVTLPADFSISPEALPALIKSLESGADVVVAEAVGGNQNLAMGLVYRSAAWLLRPGLRLPGVRDLLSGVSGFRLATLRQCFRDDAAFLQTDGYCANAELLARTAAEARRIAVVSVVRHHHADPYPARREAMALAFDLYRAGRRLRIPAPAAEISRAG